MSKKRLVATRKTTLRERPIDRRQVACAQAHTLAFPRRPQPGGPNERAFPGHVVNELAHVVHKLLARDLAAVRRCGSSIKIACFVSPRAAMARRAHSLPPYRTSGPRIDMMRRRRRCGRADTRNSA